MPKVLFVDHVSRILGGAEVNLIELLPALAADQAWVLACACSQESPLASALKGQGVTQFGYSLPAQLNQLRLVGRSFSLLAKWQGWRALQSARAGLNHIIEQWRPDAVVSCTNKDHFCAGPVCKRTGLPSIWWINDILSPAFFPWSVRRLFRSQARRSGAWLVAVSEFVRQALIAEGVSSDRVVTIRNGIPLARYARRDRGLLRARFAIPPDALLVGLVGRFTPWKGQEFFLRIANLWSQKSELIHFVLIGQAFNEDHAYEAGLKRFVVDHNLERSVHFVPFQSDIAAVLSDLDVLMHTSTKPEPFGRVLIEAMAVGVPVIAAQAGGVGEILVHGKEGLLAEPGDLGAYAGALGELLESSAARQTMAQAARRRVEQEFTIERVRKQFEQLLSSVCPAPS